MTRDPLTALAREFALYCATLATAAALGAGVAWLRLHWWFL